MSTDPRNSRLACADLMERIARSEGLAPNAGRILGYLLMSDQPVSFSELHDVLGISKGSVSENTSHLETIGLLERMQPEGVRSVFFRYRKDAAEVLLERAIARGREHLEQIASFYHSQNLSGVQARRVSSMTSFMTARISSAENFRVDLRKERQTDPS